MSLLDIFWWLFLAFLVVVVVDFIRLAILRVIWNRRHARMVKEVARRYANGTCRVSTLPLNE